LRVLVKDALEKGSYPATLAQIQMFPHLPDLPGPRMELKVDVKTPETKQLILDFDFFDTERMRDAFR